MQMLQAAADVSATDSPDALAWKTYVAKTDLYLRADRSGETIRIYKVPVPGRDWEVVPVYLSRARYDAELA